MTGGPGIPLEGPLPSSSNTGAAETGNGSQEVGGQANSANADAANAAESNTLAGVAADTREPRPNNMDALEDSLDETQAELEGAAPGADSLSPVGVAEENMPTEVAARPADNTENPSKPAINEG